MNIGYALSTDNTTYTLGDTVTILVDEEKMLKNYTLYIESLRYLGNEDIINFIPKKIGNHTIMLLDEEKNIIEKTTFFVLAPVEYKLETEKINFSFGETIIIYFEQEKNYTLKIIGAGNMQYIYFSKNNSEPAKFAPPVSGEYFLLLYDATNNLVKNKTLTILQDDATFLEKLFKKNKESTSILNIQEENSHTKASFVQLPAKVDQAVLWMKTLHSTNNTPDGRKRLNIENIHKNYQQLNIKKVLPNGQKTAPTTPLLDYTSAQGHSPAEMTSIPLLVFDAEDIYEVSYETSAPTGNEEIFDTHHKRIHISTPTPYTNVLARTTIPDTPQESIEVYVLQGNTKRLLTNISYLDTNANNLIDTLTWNIPFLESIITYEVSITILNTQSYPVVGGNWTVIFNTTGTANLTIKATNGTNWSKNNESYDLLFLELRCGETILDYEWINDSVFVNNYFCDDLGYETSKVLTPGNHTLFFNFGGQTGYAYNQADVPSLHTVQGYIHENDSVTQAPAGTNVRLNATATLSLVYTKTSGPPGHEGFYSANINATDNETTVIWGFNATAYGVRSVELLRDPGITKVNVTMNLSRPGEANTTITSPSNSSVQDQGRIFNITITIGAIGGADIQNCNATLSLTNQNAFNITGTNFTNQVGNISLGNSNTTLFEMRAFNGTSNAIIDVDCSSDTLNFENLDVDVVTLIASEQPPTLHTIQGYVHQSDNVTQVPAGTNVTVNATTTGSFITVETNGPPGHEGFYSAIINATDGEFIIVTARNNTYKGTENISLPPNPEVTKLNISLNTLIIPDLFVNGSLIWFSNYTPAEDEEILISSNVSNIGEGSAGSFIVQFYNGDPDDGGSQIGNNQTISGLDYSTTITINQSYTPTIGPQTIHVLADVPLQTNGSVNESNETNNEGNITYHLPAYQTVYGNVSVDLFIGNTEKLSVLNWSNNTNFTGNIFVSDQETTNSINFASLQAIGRNISGSVIVNDFSNIDELLNMSSYNDSVANIYTSDGNTPKTTGNITLVSNTITNVPIINSTNNSNFFTGILWDTSDDVGDGEFDITDKEDIIFINEINYQATGKLGVYDYELNYPALLRAYDETDSTSVFIYFELQ